VLEGPEGKARPADVRRSSPGQQHMRGELNDLARRLDEKGPVVELVERGFDPRTVSQRLAD